MKKINHHQTQLKQRKMEKRLFDQLEMAEQVPTELMTEITKNKSDVLGAVDHTEVKAEDVFNNLSNQSTGFKNDPSSIGPEMNSHYNDLQQKPQAQKINAANLITGQMAVSFLDMLLPVICVLIIEKINGRKINKKYLQASPDERKVLEPVLHNYLASIDFNVDTPLNALLITVAFIYGTKTIEVLNDLPQSHAAGVRAEPFPKEKGKETRGRHKKDCQCPVCKQKRSRV